ncbi:Plasmodium falciparum CPW-WPC domain containing protein, putative [Babesia bigemina]|uniref:Plasmodium falciparum CPW-WPC domain containing protein, putative n=1 Tax=Babesia bigemina TaxID=5866 RepID=A0A061DC45_BABBI|nr:Plasmodium falciparum CPW-WPC domain containing protein, putative [Babesia bigemina]CDR95320.1 Plasmodium falciparum CPW-WPC domain containing protein, putative [Babesia bigemina]|eukprot:XP_012767506.1 Plasmodium falciparum CPW-WPC domain containing protein, putative [Babesia bigemina]
MLKYTSAIHKQRDESTRLADDSNLEVGDSMGGMASTATMNLDPDDPNILPDAHNIGHNLVNKLEERAVEIADKIAKHRHTESDKEKKEADAKHDQTLFLCQRDYSQPCPLGFKHVATEDGKHKCIFPASYTGPCLGQELVYRLMPEEEKLSWALDCLANWPCVQCTRRYSDLCPEKWELDTQEIATKGLCKAKDEYQGPCKDEKHAFINYNIGMQKQWSHRCQAWWPCDNSSRPGQTPDADMPITMAATAYRMGL